MRPPVAFHPNARDTHHWGVGAVLEDGVQVELRGDEQLLLAGGLVGGLEEGGSRLGDEGGQEGEKKEGDGDKEGPPHGVELGGG